MIYFLTTGSDLALFEPGDKTIEARKELLIEQRKQLAKRMEEMQNTLERLDEKIEGYEQKVLTREKELKKS